MKSEQNIIFIGFMGCGKTTVGRKISKRMGYQFIDTDKYIEKAQDMSINDIFAQKGEEYFRNLEHDMCIELSKAKKCVIATGGGIIKNDDNITLLKTNGVVIYLKATPEHIYKNIGQDTTRPLLQGDNKLEKIRSLMKDRRALYEKYADITINVAGSTVNYTADKIIKALEDRNI